jgi:myo-inositol catabolism protein IolC
MFEQDSKVVLMWWKVEKEKSIVKMLKRYHPPFIQEVKVERKRALRMAWGV